MKIARLALLLTLSACASAPAPDPAPSIPPWPPEGCIVLSPPRLMRCFLPNTEIEMVHGLCEMACFKTNPDRWHLFGAKDPNEDSEDITVVGGHCTTIFKGTQ